MAFSNIVEICVAIDIAILGIAYPIIIDKISGIGEKFSSNYLSNIFNSEFPQRPIKYKWRKYSGEISIFKLILYCTIISFLLLIFDAEPWFGWDNGFINNSANLIVLLITIVLTVCFFQWLDIVVKYNGKATSLLQYLTTRYHASEATQDDYNLKTINEFAIYAINQQDEHLQETLLEFYYLAFSNIRQKHDRTKPLVYPYDLYEIVYRLCYKLVDTDNKNLLALEHRAVSATWLLGEDFEEIEISEETYEWLWRIMYAISDKEKFIRMYWSTAHQYTDMQMPYIMAEHNDKFEIINQVAIDKRQREKKRYFEFHFALGGLLLYREQYSTLKYIFTYTQSQPPRYALLPESMTQIFAWFESFSNEFKSRREPLDRRYSFPELDNLGTRRQVNFWMCSYMTLLFVRLYSLNQHYTYQNFTAQPNLPDSIAELRDWLQAVPFFESCLKRILENEKLLKILGFEKVVEEHQADFSKYIEDLKARLIEKSGTQKLNAALSAEKLQKFKDSSIAIIKEAFSKYESIKNLGEYTEQENDLKLTVTGQTILTGKNSFIEDTGVHHLNFDTILAESIASHSIRKYIPNSFLVAKSRRYLLNQENINDGIQKLIGNKKDVVIVAVNLSYDTKATLEKYKSQIIEIKGSEYRIQDCLFVLKKSDLPFIIHRELDAKVVADEKFELIDNNLKLYSAILDLSLAENTSIREKYTKEDLEDELKVQTTLAFLTLIVYKNKREIVQLNIASQYKEQGIQNKIEEIEPLS
ncbi:hypothetical protein [Flavobacterium aquatile]|uniref:Uncharacterized protein n=1 Tax=Flavobacterium aquatile LMG 4008 = ATCC 11947 TaxID=1453498 RepID=A0A095SY61_9FLAO|nr:hypothetical protein [Flavobacterium aquatile]KGD69596.1 hypothetical protein LG45_02215 [Flavobacterium aquatile LMG 4008 = ATCC 11947]OXA67268.1 hypothetical protein B0A61_08665 [Flavobacterium aquatile LMG 4008 = ATCC 11947]GEC77927.1 hypothetical protein FAQ01_07970 [Flavobacterium aquatile]